MTTRKAGPAFEAGPVKAQSDAHRPRVYTTRHAYAEPLLPSWPDLDSTLKVERYPHSNSGEFVALAESYLRCVSNP